MANLETDLTLKAEINLYYDVYTPDGAANAPLLIAVHGYGAHKRYMMREARAAAPDDFVVASIQAPHQHYSKLTEGYRIGFGWLSDHKPEEYIAIHHDFVQRVIDMLAERGTVDASRVYLYGFSQACALNFRFAFTYPDVLKGIVAVCGGVPSDLGANKKYRPFDADTFYLYGDNDEFYSQEKLEGFRDRLQAMLPNFRSKKYRAGHEITEEMRGDIRKFLSGE